MGHTQVQLPVTTHRPGAHRDGVLYDILDLRVDRDYEPLDLRIAAVNALEQRVLDNAQAFDYALRELAVSVLHTMHRLREGCPEVAGTHR